MDEVKVILFSLLFIFIKKETFVCYMTIYFKVSLFNLKIVGLCFDPSLFPVAFFLFIMLFLFFSLTLTINVAGFFYLKIFRCAKYLHYRLVFAGTLTAAPN